jgi:hypothetical protein
MIFFLKNNMRLGRVVAFMCKTPTVPLGQSGNSLHGNGGIATAPVMAVNIKSNGQRL